jgi:calcineurin-like phosphoesterase
MLRPANYPSGSQSAQTISGSGHSYTRKNNIDWVVINLQGRELMSSLIDCPFQCFDRLIKMFEGRVTDNHPLVSMDGESFPSAFPLILVDFHAESSREKEALAYYIDGRASLIAGTHTHVQTADEKLLPRGSAYITDLGMTGNIDSVIGMNPAICLERSRKHVLYHMETATAVKPGRIQGVIAEINSETGRAISITRI